MKQNILILSLLLILSNCDNDIYSLFLGKTLTGGNKCRVNIVNRKKGISDKDLFYSGSFEYLTDILSDKKDKYDSIREENHPFVFNFGCKFEYIKYFKPETVFVIGQFCYNYEENYYDYTIFSTYQESDYFRDQLITDDFSYVSIGKELEDYMKIFFYVVIGMNFLINIFLSFIMKRIMRNMNLNNILLINFLIIRLSNYLFIANIFYTISFFFFEYLPEYMSLIIAPYKATFYIDALLIIKGWMITHFDISREIFKKNIKRSIILSLYEIFVSMFIHTTFHLINFTSKLNIFYIKDEIEQIVFLIYFVYCIIKVLVPLYKQMNYEQSLRTDFAECLKFKYKRLFKIYVLFGIHSLIIMIAPLIEKEIFYAYLYNYQLHYSFYLFYAVNFCLVLNIIFFPKQLPNNYFDNVVYNFRRLENLEADIYEGDGKENHNTELNVSNLSSNYLKNISKKDNYPIILIDPFASSKAQHLFNHIHIGIAQRNQD